MHTPSGVRLRTATIPAAAQAPSRGVCLLLNGQTEFIEKYCEVVAALSARGFTTVTFDWRGQGLSDRALPDPLKAHIGDFAEYDEDLATVMADIVAPLGAGPPLALAHSMGAHILLRTLRARPDTVRAAMLSSPMIAFSTRGYPEALTRAVTAAQILCGRAADFAWGMAARDPLKMTFDDNMVTADRGCFDRTQRIIAADPRLRLAGPTWGWIAAAYRSIAEETAPGFAEAIATPMLVCIAGCDRIVHTAATRAFARRLPHADCLELPQSGHEILMETDAVRARFWDAFDGFVTHLSSPSPRDPDGSLGRE